MASTYNGRLRPAEVVLEGGELRLSRRRETLDDLIARGCVTPCRTVRGCWHWAWRFDHPRGCRYGRCHEPVAGQPQRQRIASRPQRHPARLASRSRRPHHRPRPCRARLPLGELAGGTCSTMLWRSGADVSDARRSPRPTSCCASARSMGRSAPSCASIQTRPTPPCGVRLAATCSSPTTMECRHPSSSSRPRTAHNRPVRDRRPGALGRPVLGWEDALRVN